MKKVDVEIKVAISKIARALEGISPVVGLKAIMMFLIALVCHSKNPKRLADYIIGVLKRAVGGTNDDRNFVDLSKIWHDASEEPEDNFTQILYREKIGTYRITVKHDIVMLMGNWEDFSSAHLMSQWAYVSDLLPRGGGE